MFRTYITLLIICIAYTLGLSQDYTFKDIDSTSYKMYTEERWNELIRYGNKIKDLDVDYYYFNIRLGIAYFNQHQYYSAEKYLLKALKNNETELARQYLFWTYLWLGESIKADMVYNKLSEESRNYLNYRQKVFDYFYFETGTKSASLVNNSAIYYLNMSAGHRLKGNSRLNHSFNTYFQSEGEQQYLHNQYSIKANVPVKNGIAGFGGIYGATSEKVIFPFETEPKKVIKKASPGLYIDYSIRIGRFYTKVNMNFLFTITDSIYSIHPPMHGGSANTPAPLNKTFYNNTFITSLSLHYTPKVFADKLRFGIDNYLITSDNGTFYTYKPHLDIFFSNKIWANLNYIPIGHYTFWDKSTNRLYNDSKYSRDCYSATINFLAFSKTTLNLTYLFEKIEDRNTLEITSINSIYLGILYNF